MHISFISCRLKRSSTNFYLNFGSYLYCLSLLVFGCRRHTCPVHRAHAFFGEALVQYAVRVLLTHLHVSVHGFFRVVELNFLVDEFFELAGAQAVELEVEVESRNWFFFDGFLCFAV